MDDTDLLQVNNTVEEVVLYMQKKLTEWNQAVGITGGILSPSKCWWYLITFKYIAGRWKAVSPQGDFQLWLQDESKKRIYINRLHPDKGTNMLGVYLAPDGNNKDHLEALRKKAERWADNIQSSRANQEEVWTALHRTIPFSLCYSLPAVTLSHKECRYIMAPITKHGLPAAGIASTTPHVVKVGSIAMGGLGIIDPNTYMGVSQIATFISNTWQKTPTGMLLEIALDDLALELGISTPWNQEYLKTSLTYATTSSWIHHMVQFSIEKDIKIDLVPNRLLQPNRENDRTIMESAMEHYSQATELQSINKVQMALNVIWLSDIGTADGQYIDTRWLFPMPHPYNPNRHLWPSRHHILQVDWRRWRRWARHICTNQQYRFRNQLGEWQYDENT